MDCVHVTDIWIIDVEQTKKIPTNSFSRTQNLTYESRQTIRVAVLLQRLQRPLQFDLLCDVFNVSLLFKATPCAVGSGISIRKLKPFRFFVNALKGGIFELCRQMRLSSDMLSSNISSPMGLALACRPE